MAQCHVWQPWVPHVGRMSLLELHGLTGAGVFVAAGATDWSLQGVGHHSLLASSFGQQVDGFAFRAKSQSFRE